MLLTQRGGEEGESPIKRMGVLVGNFEKNPLEVPRSCLVGVAWYFFTPIKEVQVKVDIN